MKLNHPVRLFKCHTNNRIGVAEMDKTDKAVFLNHLRNVAGSLPTTVKEVRKALEGPEGNTLFVNINHDLVGIFDSKGLPVSFPILPKAFNAMLALTISGMKVRDNEASYLIRAHQIMVKKSPYKDEVVVQKLMFDISDSDSEDEF